MLTNPMEQRTAEAIVAALDKYKVKPSRMTADEARLIVEAWCAAKWRLDFHGNYLTEEGTRFHFSRANLQHQEKRYGRWSNLSSKPYKDVALNLIKNAATTLGREDLVAVATGTKAKRKSVQEKRYSREEEKLAREQARKEITQVIGAEMPWALLDVSRGQPVTPEMQARLDQLEDEGVRGAALEALRASDLTARVPTGPLVGPVHHEWTTVQDGVAYTVRLVPDPKQKAMRVFVGRSGSQLLGDVDPKTGWVSSAGWSSQGGAQDKLQGDGYISAWVRWSDQLQGLFGALYLISAQDKQHGAGSRMIKIWLRMLDSLRVRTWVAQAVGEEGLSFLQKLQQRGWLKLTPGTGSNVVVNTLMVPNPSAVRENPPLYSKARLLRSLYQKFSSRHQADAALQLAQEAARTPPMRENPAEAHPLVVALIGKAQAQVVAELDVGTLLMLTPPELERRGLTRKSAGLIRAAAQLGAEAARAKPVGGKKIAHPQHVVDLMQDRLALLPHEEVWCLYLDRQNVVLSDFLVSKNGLDTSMVDPREILREAFVRRAAAFVLVHNHPSGDKTTSSADREVTRRMHQVGALSGIKLLDHVVIARGGFSSLAEEGALPLDQTRTNPGGDDIWDFSTIQQEVTSADTSVNDKKLPRTFSVLSRIDGVRPGDVIADIGGGKFDNAVRWAAKRGAKLHVIDPFNRSEQHNRAAVAAVAGGQADLTMSNNVLNVIREPENRHRVLLQMRDALREGGTGYVHVYKGNGSGIGGPTKKGWQNHRRISDYLPEVLAVFPDARLQHGIIVVHK